MNKADVTSDEELEDKYLMKVGGGYEDIDEENKWTGYKDLYISKLDTLIKKELGSIRNLWKSKEKLEMEIANSKYS